MATPADRFNERASAGETPRGAGHGSAKRLAPGEKIRVLVVDDSVVIRRLVADTLASDDEIEVAGVAANGQIALARIPQVNPHVITLDIEMPEMDGLETLRQVRKLYPGIRVIMFSTLTERGAAATFEALALGASDYATKASNCGSIGASTRALHDDLVPKVKAFFPRAVPVAASSGEHARLLPKNPAGAAPAPPEVVVVGVSTGGPNALSTLVPMLPANFPLPILVVQHMPPMFTKFLADRLQNLTKLCVREAKEGDPVEPSTILIAPGDYHMRLARKGVHTVVKLDHGTPENSCRPAVDVLFRSAMEHYGPAVIAVVLTGMGQDGLRGATGLKEGGAAVIAQDEQTSVVWGMPGFVARAGIADRVLPLEQIVPGILEIVRTRR